MTGDGLGWLSIAVDLHPDRARVRAYTPAGLDGRNLPKKP